MAKRLTVIISQSSSRHSQAADAEERLLSELIMAPGIDATLIGSLDNVQPDSTDYLCLSGFAGQTLAVVSSLSFEQVAQQWSRLQLSGHVVRMGQAGVPGQRRVIYFPLTSDTPAMLSELRQLLADQAVQTVGVLVPLGRAIAASSRSLPLISSSATVVGQPGGLPPTAPRQQTSQSSAEQPSANQPLASRSSELPESKLAAQEEEWPDLDRLVDDLDALDL